MAKRSNITREQLEAAVAANTTMAGAIKALGMTISGGTYATMRSRIRRWDINVSHWLGQSHAKGKKAPRPYRRKPLEEVLVVGKLTIGTATLKERLIEADLLENKCSECGQSPVWNNKPLVLELDHINGDRLDNRIENLRILCGHCHSQTPTFRGRNKRPRPRRSK
ncbi:MAG: HNH endonuclease [Nitrospira sp.]